MSAPSRREIRAARHLLHELRAAKRLSSVEADILARAYGPEFLAVAMPGCGWLAGPAREARAARLRQSIAHLERDLLDLEAKL